MSKSKKQKKYQGEIPFNIFGDQLHYPEGHVLELKAENFREDGVYAITEYYPEHIWRKIYFQDQVREYAEPKVTRWDYDKKGIKDIIGEIGPFIELNNYEFTDTLVYSGYSRGRSAAYFNFKSKTDERNYTVFLTDFEEMVFKMANGEITGKFTFCKRGQNFGLKMI